MTCDSNRPGIIITIEDEGGGEFVEIRNEDSVAGTGLRIDQEEWPTLREAIERMVAECRNES
jgi:hypothetical protein